MRFLVSLCVPLVAAVPALAQNGANEAALRTAGQTKFVSAKMCGCPDASMVLPRPNGKGEMCELFFYVGGISITLTSRRDGELAVSIIEKEDFRDGPQQDIVVNPEDARIVRATNWRGGYNYDASNPTMNSAGKTVAELEAHWYATLTKAVSATVAYVKKHCPP